MCIRDSYGADLDSFAGERSAQRGRIRPAHRRTAHAVRPVSYTHLDVNKRQAVGVAPLLRRHGLTGGSIPDLPPAGDGVVSVHLHQLRADALHQRDGHGVAGGGVKAGHDVRCV